MTLFSLFSKPTPAYTGVGAFPDTSRNGTRAVRGLPVASRAKIPTRLVFSFASAIGGKVRGPKGYAFNGRGDLVSLKRQARRDRARGGA